VNDILRRVAALLIVTRCLSSSLGTMVVMATLKSHLVYGSIRRIQPCLPSILRRPTSHIKPFQESCPPHRAVQQIDLVPTLSILLRLPVPLNNLGTVISELFWRDRSGSNYAEALDINARQVHWHVIPLTHSGIVFQAVNSMGCGEPGRLLGLAFTGASQKKGLKPQSINVCLALDLPVSLGTI
jgi:hypothetical protein